MGGAAQQHLEPSRPRGRARAPTARSPSAITCAACCPQLLALSANSPFLDGRDTGLHSVRTEIFTRTFPRCGVHEPFGGWDAYADFVDLLVRTDSIVEATQLWWSVRPHHAFGTVELRICDAQTRGEESFALAGADRGLHRPGGARLRRRAARPTPLRQREIEENLWRAIRHGLDGQMIDFDRRRGDPDPRGGRAPRGVDGAGSSSRWASRSRSRRRTARSARAGARGGSVDRARSIADAVAETQRTYAPEGVSTAVNAEEGQPEHSREPRRSRARRSCAQRIEEQLRKVRVQDLLLESVVSVLNLAARRIAKEDERTSSRRGSGSRPCERSSTCSTPEPAAQVRDALSELQMLYAKTRAKAGSPRGGRLTAARGRPAATAAPGSQGGPSKLWTPGRG